MTLKTTHLLLSLTLFLVTVGASAQPPADSVIELDQNTQTVFLGDALYYLDDAQQILYLDTVADPDFAAHWQKSEHHALNLGLAPGIYWLKTTLKNRSDQPLNLLLETEYPSINKASLFRQNNPGELKEIYSNVGLDTPFVERPIEHRNILTRLEIDPYEELTLYWQIDSHPIFRFRASIWDPQAFYSFDQHRNLLYGMLYGSMVVMGIYNLFLFLSVGRRTYLYYVAYLCSVGYMIAADQGHIYQYFGTETVWEKPLFYTISYAISTLTFFLFASHFLELGKRSRTLLYGLTTIGIATTLLVTLAGITGNEIMVKSSAAALVLLYSGVLFAAVKIRLQGVISAGHFIIAIIILVFGLIASNLVNLGLIPLTTGLESYDAIGTVLMMIFLSLALADKINSLRKENSDIQKALNQADFEKHRLNQALSRLRQKQSDLEDVANQANIENRAKSDFLATISNEIGTPMQNVLEMAQRLKVSTLNPQQSRYLETIQNSGEALLQVIDDMIDYSTVESGQMNLVNEPFDLPLLLDDCVSVFSLHTARKSIELFVEVDPEIPPVLSGDVGKLRQVLINLLSNAFKFTDQGEIVIRVSCQPSRSVNSLKVRFEVIDSGQGLTDEQQQQLFTPFIHHHQQPEHQGAGLGLAISRQLAELMDGSIGVESASGEGSTFWFTARLYLDHSGKTPAINPAKLSGRHLLLVIDHPSLEKALTTLATSWGMQVSAVQNAEQAHQLIRNSSDEPIELILVDDPPAEQDALKNVRELQQIPSLPPTILMAAFQHHSQIIGNAGITAESVVEKPLTQGQLLEAMEHALTQQEQSQETTPQLPNDMRVLVVEDNQVSQMALLGLLERMGVKADLAKDGLEAVEMATKQSYQFILMDCEMPNLDGYSATRRIRLRERERERPHAPIIGISAHSQVEHQQQGIESGMNRYLTKPLARQELYEALIELAIVE